MITYSLEKKTLYAYGREIFAWCDVRNADNGRRALHDPSQVVYSTNADGSQGKPYMPKQFPTGDWHVFATERIPAGDPRRAEFGDAVIKTDAHQTVKVWALDENGGYDHETEEWIEDYGYEIHWSPSETTLGCIHVDSQTHADELLPLVDADIAANGPIPFQVAA